MNDPVYITLIKNTAKLSKQKSSNIRGPYREVCLGTQPREILENLQTYINNPEVNVMIHKKLKPSMPTEGTDSFGDGILKSSAHIAESRLHFIDIDHPGQLRKIDIGDETRELSHSNLYPPIVNVDKLLTYLRRQNYLKTDQAKLVMWSSSMFKKNPPTSISAHVYVVLSEPLSHKEFISRLKSIGDKERKYEGLFNDAKPVIKHPYVDYATNSAKKDYIENGYGSPVKHLSGDKPLPAQWGLRSKKGPCALEPIRTYSDEDKRWAEEKYAERKALRAASSGYVERDYQNGEAFHPDEPLYNKGVFYCTAHQRVTEPKKFPLTQFDSKLDSNAQNGHMHYVKDAKFFIDYAHGENSIHTVASKLTDIPLTDGYAPIHKHVQPTDKLVCVRSDTNTGKTANTLRIKVGLGCEYKQGFFAAPTHSIVSDIESSYGVKALTSGRDAGNSTDEDILGMAWTVATMHKFAHESQSGYKCPDGVVVVDEVHNIFSSIYPSSAHRFIYNLITGDESLGQSTLMLMSATFDFDILASHEPKVLNFEHKISKTFRYVRVTPWQQMIDSERLFVAINDRAKASLMGDFMNQVGKKAIVIHGGNDVDEEGYTFTNIPDNLEELYDCIIVTSAMKEGFSLKAKYDVVYIDKHVIHHSGAADDEQFAARVRSAGAEYYIHIGDSIFNEPDTVKPNLAMYQAASKITTTADQLTFIKMFGLSQKMLAEYYIKDGSVQLDPLGLLSLYVIRTKRAENKSFELTKQALAKFGTEAIDDFTEDDYLIGDKDALEAAESYARGEYDAVWKSIIEQKKMFDEEFKIIQTHKQLDNWIENNKNSEFVFKRSKVKKIVSNKGLTKVVLRGDKETKLTEVAQVQAKKSEAYAAKVKQHARNIALGVYTKLEKQTNIDASGTLVTSKILLQQFNSFFNSLGTEPPVNKKLADLPKMLRDCCLFDMYDKDKKPMLRYSNNVRYVRVRKFGLFEDDIFESDDDVITPIIA